ncbi:MAG: hypothetical protein AABX19_00125 [Nanoarchaeota archaeon]
MGFWDFLKRRSNILIMVGTLSAAVIAIHYEPMINREYKTQRLNEEADLTGLELINKKMKELQVDQQRKLAIIEDVEDNLEKAESYKSAGNFSKYLSTLKLQLPKLQKMSFENHIPILEELKVKLESNELASKIFKERNDENHFDDMIGAIRLFEKKRLSLIAEITSNLNDNKPYH